MQEKEKSIDSDLGYVYFISYSHATGNGVIEAFVEEEIKNIEIILRISELITEELKLKNVNVINYKLLRKEKVNENDE